MTARPICGWPNGKRVTGGRRASVASGSATIAAPSPRATIRAIVSALSSTISSRTRTPRRRSSAAIMRPAQACASKRMNGSASSSVPASRSAWSGGASSQKRSSYSVVHVSSAGCGRTGRVVIAASSSPAATRFASSADMPADTCTRSDGCELRSASSASGSGPDSAVWIAPIRRRPTSFFSSLSASGIRSTIASTCSACASRMLPASVSTGCRRERSNNCTLYSLSSALICRLTADCVSPMASPARAKVRYRAMATSVLNARSDMDEVTLATGPACGLLA